VFDITDLHGYSSPAFQMSASKSEQEEDAKLIQNKVKEVEIEAERISSIRRAAAHAGRYDRFQRRLREAWETIDNPSYVDPLTGKKGKTSSSSSKRPGLGSQIQTSQEITPVSSPPPPPGPEQHDSAALVAAESSSNSSSLLKFGKNTGLDYSSDASKRAGLDFLSPSTANTGLPISAPAPTQPKQVDAAAPEADHPKERKKMTHAQWLGREYEKKQAREAMGVKGSGPSNKKTRSDLTQTGGEGNAHILALMKGPKQTDRGKRDDKLRQVLNNFLSVFLSHPYHNQTYNAICRWRWHWA